MGGERYHADAEFGETPSAFLTRHYRSLPQGEVLCLAADDGRNAVFLARQGYQVTAAGLSEVGVEKAQKLAVAHEAQIECVQADLARFDLGENRWDGIVTILYQLPPEVRRHFHSQVARALKRGGVYLLETVTPRAGEGPAGAGPMMIADALQAELTDLAFDRLDELEYDVDDDSVHASSAVVTQAIAVKADRKYSVSSNRDSARHKVRYVEAGGGEANGNCRLCQPLP